MIDYSEDQFRDLCRGRVGEEIGGARAEARRRASRYFWLVARRRPRAHRPRPPGAAIGAGQLIIGVRRRLGPASSSTMGSAAWRARPRSGRDLKLALPRGPRRARRHDLCRPRLRAAGLCRGQGAALFGSWLTTQTFTDLFQGTRRRRPPLRDLRSDALAPVGQEPRTSSSPARSTPSSAAPRSAGRDRRRAGPRHLQFLQARARHGAGRVPGRSRFREEVRSLCDRARGGADAARQRGPPQVPRMAPGRQGPRSMSAPRTCSSPSPGKNRFEVGLDVPRQARPGARPRRCSTTVRASLATLQER